MLIKLSEEFNESLSKKLRGLSEGDKRFFYPHKFDARTIKKLSNEKGNHYYVYLDDLGKFMGYGMLRTFGKYEIPSLGCVIWQEYRGQGKGKKLIKELIIKANKLKYHKIRLKVHTGNKIAYKLYKKAGFKKIEKSEDEIIWMEYSDKNAGQI